MSYYKYFICKYTKKFLYKEIIYKLFYKRLRIY
nr:MAG TPA: hypothetical protein [Caudoviricetes sp.]